MKIFKPNKSGNQIGASLVEYGLLVALIAVVAIAAIRATGQKTSQTFCRASYAISHGITSGVCGIHT